MTEEHTMTEEEAREKARKERLQDIVGTAMSMANLLTTKFTPKKHGGFNVYQDDRLIVALDTFVPNLSIRLITPQGEKTVYTASYHSLTRPDIHRPRPLGGLHPLLQTAPRSRQGGEAARKVNARPGRRTRGDSPPWTTAPSSSNPGNTGPRPGETAPEPRAKHPERPPEAPRAPRKPRPPSMNPGGQGEARQSPSRAPQKARSSAPDPNGDTTGRHR